MPNKMKPAAILAGGFVCALLLLVAILAGLHIRSVYSPTLKDSERLLARGKPREAKARLDKMKSTGRDRRGGGAGSRELLHRGKVLYAVMLEAMREEKWASYGVDSGNWLAHPLADEAERNFLDAMELAPNDPEIRLTLGSLYREQGRFAESETALRAALDIDPENAEAFLALGLLYAEGRRFPAAEKALRHAWDLDEGNPKISKNIGYYHRFYKDDPESSIVWLSRYLAADPKRDADINQVRAELKNMVERYPEFAKHYDHDEREDRLGGRKFKLRMK